MNLIEAVHKSRECRDVRKSRIIRITRACYCNIYTLTLTLLIAETWVHRGIHLFYIFALKHRSWVHVGTASRTHDLCFSANIRKISYIFLSENYNFYSGEKSKYIALPCYHNAGRCHGICLLIRLTCPCKVDLLTPHFI